MNHYQEVKSIASLLEQGKIEERGVSSEHIHNRSVNANQDTNKPINLLQQNHLLNLISHYGKAFFSQKVNQCIHLQCFKVIWNWIVQIPSRLHPHHMKKKEQSHEATHCNLLNKKWKKSMSIIHRPVATGIMRRNYDCKASLVSCCKSTQRSAQILLHESKRILKSIIYGS